MKLKVPDFVENLGDRGGWSGGIFGIFIFCSISPENFVVCEWNILIANSWKYDIVISQYIIKETGRYYF